MTDVLSRKAFFGKIFRELAGFSRNFKESIDETKRQSGPIIDPLWSDFSPSMLEDEAQRLGLQVQGMDREELLLAIQRRMREQSPKT